MSSPYSCYLPNYHRNQSCNFSLWKFFFVLLFFQLQCQTVNSHLSSTNDNLGSVATLTSSKLADFFSNYTEKRHQQMNPNERYLLEYQNWYNILIQDTDSDISRYLSNPVNEYLLTKRMGDLRRVLELMIGHQKSNNNADESHRISDFQQHSSSLLLKGNFRKLLPTLCQIDSAALGLVRLQTTYELSTTDLAKGKPLSSSSTSSYNQMTAGDCWLIGRQAYMIGEDQTAISWMKESLRRFKKEPEKEKTVDMKNILKYFAFSYYNQGNHTLALNYTQQLIKLLPGGQTELVKILESETRLRATSIKETANSFHDNNYKALCRGEKLMDSLAESQLHCSYTGPKELSAFMVLQPLKREQISLNPPITVFYDFVSDKEIEILKELAQPKLKAGTDANSVTGETQLNQRRIYLVAGLHDKENMILEKISLRIQAATGLTLTNELSTMFYYGVGGHFTPHWDYALNETLTTEKGNVIATWLTYLNDVEFGGATVFTEIKARIMPVKGSAAFWYNLLPNGKGDSRTKHAGCPVLSGSKWVLNKKFQLKKQEFRRPCRLNFDAEV